MDRHVAVGIDGSPESLAAAHWAAREALRRGTALQVVHAWQLHPRPAANVPADMTERSWAKQILAEASDSVRAAHPGLRIIDQQVKDSPVGTLLAAAERAELLVLGSRGLSGVTGFLLGSVSQRVIARSPRPVVLVRAGESSADEHLPAPDGVSPDEIPEIPYRDIVLGLDTGQPCDELIEFAFEAARRCGAALRVIHTFSTPPGYATADRVVSTPGPELLAEHEHAVVATLRPWCEKFPQVAVTETVVEGRAATELTRAASGAALVVVGRRIRDGRLGVHTGPVTHAVLHHAGCPVAVVPHA
ncbi:nucleotide-binding universal stress UspA family protein [Streptomyces sp. B4I13]|uniref:universal stress protein n=1 Tax=Streptomyces sp. B4I13 TaxID=3042271 RepID=UPI00278A03E2|nr:universal stress protein [Streptomyces sp. B4I13]MDQ0958094.1 nucleotide-binding universal stress UspA family protein [Streptomyces sp. B4I13]